MQYFQENSDSKNNKSILIKNLFDDDQNHEVDAEISKNDSKRIRKFEFSDEPNLSEFMVKSMKLYWKGLINLGIRELIE